MLKFNYPKTPALQQLTIEPFSVRKHPTVFDPVPTIQQPTVFDPVPTIQQPPVFEPVLTIQQPLVFEPVSIMQQPPVSQVVYNTPVAKTETKFDHLYEHQFPDLHNESQMDENLRQVKLITNKSNAAGSFELKFDPILR